MLMVMAQAMLPATVFITDGSIVALQLRVHGYDHGTSQNEIVFRRSKGHPD